MNGCTITVSPTSTLVTPEPISWTQPAFSWPGHVGEDDLGLLRPLALLDVQVGAAQPGTADLHDHVERPERSSARRSPRASGRRGSGVGARPSCGFRLRVRAATPTSASSVFRFAFRPRFQGCTGSAAARGRSPALPSSDTQISRARGAGSAGSPRG